MKPNPRPYAYVDGRIHFGFWRSWCKTLHPPRFRTPAGYYLYLRGRA